MDTSSDASVATAAKRVRKASGGPRPLFGVVNNAGIGFSNSIGDTLAVNAYGPKRVCDAFLPLIRRPSGRIVNVSSASGPCFIEDNASAAHKKLLTDKKVTWKQLDSAMQAATSVKKIAKIDKTKVFVDEPYGFSKACLNAYTRMLARLHPNLRINSCTPGFIKTDLTRGMGAKKLPDEGTKAILFCLLGEPKGNGRYYGSDAVRSPLDRYRGP